MVTYCSEFRPTFGRCNLTKEKKVFLFVDGCLFFDGGWVYEDLVAIEADEGRLKVIGEI